jgi:hypothetical protein
VLNKLPQLPRFVASARVLAAAIERDVTLNEDANNTIFAGTPAIQRGRADDDITHSLASLTSYRKVCRAIRHALFRRSPAKWRTLSTRFLAQPLGNQAHGVLRTGADRLQRHDREPGWRDEVGEWPNPAVGKQAMLRQSIGRQSALRDREDCEESSFVV